MKSSLSSSLKQPIKRLSCDSGKTKVEIIYQDNLQEIESIAFGHKSGAKKVTMTDHDDAYEKWLPQIQVNGYFAFIKDETTPSGMVECDSRYLALKYARKYLARKHKNYLH